MFIKFGSILLEAEHITAFVPGTGLLKVVMLNGGEYFLKESSALQEFFEEHAPVILNKKEIEHLKTAIQGVVFEGEQVKLFELRQQDNMAGGTVVNRFDDKTW